VLRGAHAGTVENKQGIQSYVDCIPTLTDLAANVPDPGASPATPPRGLDRITPPTALGRGFWLVFLSSVFTCMASGASTPVLPQFVRDELNGSAAVVGVVVGSGSIVAMLVRPLLGTLADRFGRRRVSFAGSIVGALGLAMLLIASTVVEGTAGRVLFGLGGAALNTATMAWIVDSALVHQRGRALSLFGVSIWTGLALGPQLGVTVLHAGGYQAVWAVCIALELCGLLSLVFLPEPPRAARVAQTAAQWRAAIGPVLRPGAVSAMAWSGEGVILAFLVLHLQDQGLPSGGLGGAASVFTLFAISVIAARILLASLIDRVGAAHAATIALALVGTGLAILGYASSLAVAAIGALLLGFGFAPLYPALAVLATARLPAAQRAAGIGVFTSFMDLGMAAGAFVGGILTTAFGESAPFVGAALAQLIGIALLGSARREARQLTAADELPEPAVVVD
jgi:MFS family permease